LEKKDSSEIAMLEELEKQRQRNSAILIPEEDEEVIDYCEGSVVLISSY
jgi:hypothetical protein